MKRVSAFEYGPIESLTGTEKDLLVQLRCPKIPRKNSVFELAGRKA
jgi:hypothetical protein